MDKYMKMRQIGEGAFGKAVLVKRKADASQMVIKEINIVRMSAREREEARKEVAVLAQLKHPNIVAYRESFEERGSLYIVMDYCSGGDLYSKINTQRGALFPEDQILDWFVQMCLAIKHIHDRKILHRDIKSQNIFLTSKGFVQLGDFGIAKVLNSTVELARTCIGTPYYLSPEICENKPYNNKSDVWSLGCVLYELTTLKHAFEAGNMKNLVLKIIRGSYPPVNSKYSYDLRGLVAQLFKRAPRDRPSVNSILKKPFLSQRIHKFLSSEELASEFSHTVMHGQKLARALPPPPKPAARPPAAVKRPDPAAKRYDPSKIYGAPVVKKSRESKGSVEVKKRPGSAGSRPGSAAGSRPGSAIGGRPSSSNQNSKQKPPKPQVRFIAPQSPKMDLQKKKQELLAKEKKRREELQKKEMERRHKELMEKQKMARINKAREDNWKNMVNSLGSDDSEKDAKDVQKEVREEPRWQPPVRIQPKPQPAEIQAAGRGKYDQYHAYLDKLQNDRDARKKVDVPAPAAPAGAYMAAPRVMPAVPQPAPVWRQAPKVPQPTPVYQPYNQRGQNQQQERDRLVNDFIQRRREAALNKNRGQAQLFGVSPANVDPQKPAPSPYGREEQQRPSSAESRNREEQEYLEKLRQIRQQNFNERRNLQGRMQGAKNAEAEAEARKRKAEALKKQAEDWAKQKRDHLEEKRKDLLERERRMRELRERAGVPQAAPLPKPAPAAPMTGALNAVGANPKMVPAHPTPAKAPAMTGVMEAIGITPRLVGEEEQKQTQEESPQKTNIQKQKDDILRKLNQKGPPRGKWGEPDVPAEEPKESARSRWGAGGDNLVFAEKPPDDGQESARSRWGAGDGFNLGQLSLEETASQMEATSARDRVICNPESARRQWQGPGETILNVLKGAPLSTGTMGSSQSDESASSPTSTTQPVSSEKPAVGSTITISRGPIQKGTITIKTADETAAKDETSSCESQKPESVPLSNQNAEPSVLSNQESPPSPVATQASPVKTDQSEKSPVFQKPPIPAKIPSVAEKPLLLPKPVLLPKPEAPMQFGKSTPSEVVKAQGAGSLFEKVELEEEEEEEQGAGLKKDTQKKDCVTVTDMEKEEAGVKKKSGLVMGITTGTFDMKNSELLRTCSEPDLSSLFRTLSKDTMGVRVRSLDDMSTLAEEDDETSIEEVYSNMAKVSLEEDEEEAEEDISQQVSEEQRGIGGGQQEEEEGEEHRKQKEEEEEEEEEDNEDEDLADLMSVRETMQSLLLDDTDDDAKKSPVKFSLSSDRESRGDTNDGDIEEDDSEERVTGDEEMGNDNDDNDGKAEGDDDDDHDDNNDDDVDGQEEDEEGEEEEDGAIPRSKSVDNENPQTPDEKRDVLGDFFNTDEDSDSEFQDGDYEEFDLFGRLEESRAQLEEELGAEKLIQVYKTVQALQEDEDENMEEGARIATDLLGKDKEHLYPKIFQLVMADAAFTDDNLS